MIFPCNAGRQPQRRLPPSRVKRLGAFFMALAGIADIGGGRFLAVKRCRICGFMLYFRGGVPARNEIPLVRVARRCSVSGAVYHGLNDEIAATLQSNAF